MKRGIYRRYMSIAIAILTVLTAFSVVFIATYSTPNVVTEVSNTVSNEVKNPILDGMLDELKKGPTITPTLEKIIKNTHKDEKISVYIVTDDIKALGKDLRSMGINTPIGTTDVDEKIKLPFRAIILYLTPGEIKKVSTLPEVIKIFNHPKAEIQVTPNEEKELIDGKIGNVLNPRNFRTRGIYQTLHHGAQDAWMQGFMGSNVTIAIIDTGVDFAQPNLYGAWAVEQNSASPYYGWPIVYDSWSAYLYLMYNMTGMDAYYQTGMPSWYVNTSYNTTALPNGTVYFNGHYYNVSSIHSASGHYHLGLLPETFNYPFHFGEVPAVLVVDSTTNYSYDTVYVDLDVDYDFTDEKPTNQSSPVSYRDDYDADTGNYTDAWNGGDGYPDWSGGMIYFIADGENPIPGTTMTAWWYGVPNRVPGKGDIVAFEGDFDFYPHGTACAANAASRGVTVGGLGVGMAPQAKIIAVPHFWWDPITEWMFAELGYDFSPDAGAQIASNSWGNSYVHWDGWDTVEDRFLDFIVVWVPQIFGASYPMTSFLVALGNGGPGYGTATSPAVQAAINVGAGSEWGYRQILYGDSTLYDSYYGDVVDFSARGPFANGKMTPDILTTGEFGITPYALNYPDMFGHVGDGSMHFDLFSGTSMATPVAAGGLALIYDAYYKIYGQYPDIWTAKEMLQSSADDHNYDPLSQGPGWMNVSRAIDMITGKGGISISPSVWNVGTYEGNEYSMFAGIVHPGDTISKDFKLVNMDWNTSHSAHVELTPVAYMRSYEYNITAELPAGQSSYWVNLSNLSTPIPNDIDLLQIIAYTNYSTLDDSNDTTHANPNIYYTLAYLWDYINYTSPSNYTDRMRIQVSAAQGNTIDVMFHDPMRRLHGDLWYQLRVIKYVDMDMTFRIKVVGYVATPIPQISLSQSSVALTGGNGSATITATINVPNDMPFGIYEAKILVDDGVHISSIPVVMYVAPEITSLSDTVTFGGNELSDYNTYLYDNSHIRGLYDWGWRAEA